MVTKLLVLDSLFSISITFVYSVGFAAVLMKCVILFSVSVTFVLKTAVVAKSVILDTLFKISVFRLSFLTSPFYIFLSLMVFVVLIYIHLLFWLVAFY